MEKYKKIPKEICKKCKRKYDGKYPCPCGGIKFEELKEESKN